MLGYLGRVTVETGELIMAPRKNLRFAAMVNNSFCAVGPDYPVVDIVRLSLAKGLLDRHFDNFAVLRMH